MLSPIIAMPAQKGDKKHGRGGLIQAPPRNTLGIGYPHTRFVQRLMAIPTSIPRPDSSHHISGTNSCTQSHLPSQGSPPAHGHRSDQETPTPTQVGSTPTHAATVINTHGLRSMNITHAPLPPFNQGHTCHPTHDTDGMNNRDSFPTPHATSDSQQRIPNITSVFTL